MIKQAIGLLALSGALAAACGCNVCRALVYDPFGPNTLCDGRRCGPRGGGEVCGPVCDEPCGPPPLRGRCGVRGAVVEPSEDGCCGTCGVFPCRCRCRIIRGPLSLVFALFGVGTYRGQACGESLAGCGERYWGDWYGDPPECSSPCDCYGNFTGGPYPAYGSRSGLAAGMAGPYEDSSAAPPSGGCRTCGQGGYASQSRGTQRYPANYASASGVQHYPTTQPSGEGYAAQSPSSYAWRRSGAQYTSRAQRGSVPPPSAPYTAGPYSPRLISTTDRVAKPATVDQAPRLAEPQRADVIQE
jgi:hypothetical protein